MKNVVAITVFCVTYLLALVILASYAATGANWAMVGLGMLATAFSFAIAVATVVMAIWVTRWQQQQTIFKIQEILEKQQLHLDVLEDIRFALILENISTDE